MKKIDVNQLATYFAQVPFQIEGIYRYAKEPGVPYASMTDQVPGFIFPIKGKTQFSFNQVSYVFQPGKVIHGGAYMDLTHTKFDDVDFEYILVLYQIFDNNTTTYPFSSEHFELIVGQSPRLQQLIIKLWQAYNEPGGISMFQTEMLFRDVLNEVFLSAMQQKSEDTYQVFLAATTYIHNYYVEPIPIATLAAQNGVNRNRLTYVFKRHAGMGPAEYILRYRLNRGKEMLLTSPLPIQQIAHEIGFSDPFYFSRTFKKYYGIAPSSYRERVVYSV
ncbi:AraC family transcriptional regulator [Lysinibacillus alkalisoli]|uniref:AraC family transcriptional regulator n=1 Tax=Lysinibacillus alkalisoli TaxID=1911548 RepID=A0A917G9B7_9BACI|nr:AraC family transcriptional regulator [Lysinibacillus alkalisoli]GGG29480.1 AraC family transcriptional regulator [Lysinibacillus alkalisoli]